MKALLHKSVKKYLNKQTSDKQTQIRAAIKDLEKEPPEGDIKPLVGVDNIYRLRVGNYRIIFEILATERIIIVISISPRGDAYKRSRF